MNNHSLPTRKSTAHTRALAVERNAAEALPYLETAIPIGLAGAASTAAFVFVMDVIAGQPLATPNALGAAIFRGVSFDLASPIAAINVLSYTLLHAALFIIAATAAIVAEFTLTQRGVSPKAQFVTGAFTIFAGLQTSILTLLMLLDVPLTEEFGFGRLLAINAVAATTMATAGYARLTGRIGNTGRS